VSQSALLAITLSSQRASYLPDLSRKKPREGTQRSGIVRIAMGAIIDRNNNIVAFQANILSTISFLKIWFER
jgi:hypothetical protein